MKHARPRLKLTTRGRIVFSALLGLLIAAPVVAFAGGPNTATVPTSITQSPARKLTISCSGTLGAWTTLAHANFGDLTDTDGDPQADVVIVGDSITTRGYNELATWLGTHGKTLAGSYWSGRPTTNAVDWALSLTTKPAVLVMASGTNDIFDPAVMTAQVARLKTWAAAAPVTRLIWVDVQAARPATALCDQRNSMWVNSQIRQGMAGGEVCGWSYGFADNPARLDMYLDDGVHPIDAAGGGVGTNYWAAVVGGCIL